MSVTSVDDIRKICDQLQLQITGMRWNGMRLVVQFDELHERTQQQLFEQIEAILRGTMTDCVAEVIALSWHKPTAISFSWKSPEPITGTSAPDFLPVEWR